MLREYQRKAVNDLYAWVRENKGNPCLVLPTAAGKSHICAELFGAAIKHAPGFRGLMLTHSKELIVQNHSKFIQAWPSAPCGIYSASVGQKNINSITFAGIQSIGKKAYKVGHIDLCVIDECHLVSHKKTGLYRKMISDLQAINPKIRIVGLTATPYRLGAGYIHDGDTIFDGIIEPVSIIDLIEQGFLSILKSKHTDMQIDTSSVAKRGGEFVEKDLQQAVDINKHNLRIAKEIIERAGNRKKWLMFCTGVEHSKHICESLQLYGVRAGYIHGGMPRQQRDQILNDHYNGKLTALVNCQILTTGYDSPNIDLISLIRPTMSTSLHIQMLGRGMRIKDHTDHCLILDFVGNILRLGPVTNPIPPKKAGKGDGEAPVKLCPVCSEILHLSLTKCPECGFEFPKQDKLSKFRVHNDDVMGIELSELMVKSWFWSEHISKAGNRGIKCLYSGGLSGKSITEYFPVGAGGTAGSMAIGKMRKIAKSSHCDIESAQDLKMVADIMNNGLKPIKIEYRKDGKYDRIINRVWDNPPF